MRTLTGSRVARKTRFDPHRLPFAFAALRQPRRQAIGKTLWAQAKTRFNLPIGNGQSVVKFNRIGEVTHAELVQPLQRAGAALATNHNIDQKPLRVHCISLASRLASDASRAAPTADMRKHVSYAKL